MKKILSILALFCAVVSVNAQIATENSKVLDNVSVGVTVGATTPLDFNSVFPLNTNLGLKISKEFTPVVGMQIEGLAILNDNHFSDVKTLVKATNVGVNGTVNLSNLLCGYNGSPRKFEVSTVTGLGWLHTWTTSCNYLTAKTGVDLAWNLGSNKEHSIVVTPAVFWNLNKYDKIAFNKNGAQLGLNIGYVYHFMTSNGTHHFKTYDIGAMNDELRLANEKINTLRTELAKKPKTTETVVTERLVEKVRTEWVVWFAQNSAELTTDAVKTLNTVGSNSIVDIVATASPEGTVEFNQKLSEKRAEAVATFLKGRGVKVNSYMGMGVQGGASNRLAIVTVTE